MFVYWGFFLYFFFFFCFLLGFFCLFFFFKWILFSFTVTPLPLNGDRSSRCSLFAHPDMEIKIIFKPVQWDLYGKKLTVQIETLIRAVNNCIMISHIENINNVDQWSNINRLSLRRNLVSAFLLKQDLNNDASLKESSWNIVYQTPHFPFFFFLPNPSAKDRMPHKVNFQKVHYWIEFRSSVS